MRATAQSVRFIRLPTAGLTGRLQQNCFHDKANFIGTKRDLFNLQQAGAVGIAIIQRYFRARVNPSTNLHDYEERRDDFVSAIQVYVRLRLAGFT